MRGGDGGTHVDVVQRPHRGDVGRHDVVANTVREQNSCRDDRRDIATHACRSASTRRHVSAFEFAQIGRTYRRRKANDRARKSTMAPTMPRPAPNKNCTMVASHVCG